ncbi:hypothetical protein C0993_008634 [Termitomyces sp. T159_Od127]|nr:hypothetical protein C0993_008634 [Termitomyces sp. T159_Od127]
MEYHGQMALQIAILVAFTQLIPEHQVQVFGFIKTRVKTLPMAYLTLSTVLCLVGFQCPWIVIQFGWFVGWVYLRFYKKNISDTIGGTVTYGDRSETFSLVSWFPRWFADLQNVKELWSVRASALRWLSTSGFAKSEIGEMRKILDEACRLRVVEIWRLQLAQSMDSFGQRLDSTLLSLAESGKARHQETSLVNFLFQAPPIPNSLQLSTDTPFQKYTSSLRQQLVGRTALLDDVLATLESCARTIQQDLAHVMAGDESPELVQQLETTHRPEADALCANVIEKLEKTANQAPNTDGLVFISRVSDELSTSSPFISEIGCQASVLQDFRKTTAALHGRVVDRWRTYTVSMIVREHRTARRPIHPVLAASLKPSGPSQLPSDVDLDTVHQSATDALSRTQTLFATLLPRDKFTALLGLGVPPQEGQFQPAVALAKPTSRFGLVLVGNA